MWAYAAPFLFVIAVGVRDLWQAMESRKKLDEAAFAASQWAKAYTFDEKKMTAAAEAATKLTGVAVSPWHPCGCPTGAGIVASSCSATCSGGQSARRYIIVNTAMCYSPTFQWPGLSYCAEGDSQCGAAHCNSKQILIGAQSLTLQ
jgi:hypothetical protein